AEKILEKCKKASCLLIGCGLGHTKETEKLVAELVEKSPCPVVLDADGINSLCPNIDVLYKTKSQVILTPHPAELARLCGCETNEILTNRLEFARQLSEKYSVTVLAKGAETLAVYRNKAILIDRGNTALSKGGSGDMLAGITASFVSQKMDLQKAGALASFVMGKNAENASEYHSERGLLASDLLDFIPETLKQMES
ncbi:MAG: NAD(P)H-hydrate dehydratase, partial [Hominimerdicola sp.]